MIAITADNTEHKLDGNIEMEKQGFQQMCY